MIVVYLAPKNMIETYSLLLLPDDAWIGYHWLS